MVTETRLDSGMRLVYDAPSTTEKRPAVVLLHERYGLVQATRNQVPRMVAEGFVACAPDLFHRAEVDMDAVARGEVRVSARLEDQLADLDETVAFLRNQPSVDGDRIGIVGFCASGLAPILYSARRGDAAAIVTFYGAVGGRQDGDEGALSADLTALVPGVSCPFLGQFGEIDHSHSMQNIRLFRNAMEAANKSYDIRVYRDAPHGWLNETMPGRYREATAALAWETMVAFLRATFDGAWEDGRVLARYEADIAADYDFSRNVRFE
jgi:carboxymethylenebutenolidase